MAEEAKWYVVHTYSGYENKVKANLEKIIENRSLQNVITDVKIPVRIITEEPKEDAVSAADEAKAEDESDITAESDKKKEPKIIEEKIFPSYVFVKMIMNDETWHVVRNIRGVTGFVGPGSRPVPLTDEEVANIGELEEQTVINLSYKVGDSVKITAGFLKDAVGKVAEISDDKKKIMVIASMFGRDMPVELGSDEVTLLEG